MNDKKLKIAIVGSSGGHLTHMYMLKDFWKKHDRFWVTFNKTDAQSLLKNERKYWCYYPTNRNFFNLIRNTFLALKIIIKEKPDLIISSGAAVAMPFFLLGKIFRKKLVYVEVFDRIDKPTVSGKFCYKFADKFIVQWDEQLKVYPKAINLGSIF
jgi:UDP-N-acetylglucosamine:LPS N-acetylglucosamine transferase